MADDIAELRATAERGYAHPAKSILAALDALDAANERADCAERDRDEALKAVKVCQNASRTLDAGRQEVIRNLQKPIREERLAVATLDSEREANARLTEELDAAKADCEAAKADCEAAKTMCAEERQRVKYAIAERDDENARAQLLVSALARVEHDRDEARAERDALAELLRRAGETMELADRLIDYFANNRTIFYGGGTPATCRAGIRALTAEIEAALDPKKSPARR